MHIYNKLFFGMETYEPVEGREEFIKKIPEGTFRIVFERKPCSGCGGKGYLVHRSYQKIDP